MNPNTEVKFRQEKIRSLMKKSNVDALLINRNVNLLYAAGRIFSGYLYLPVQGEAYYFIKRPNNLTGSQVVYIHKPEQIPEILAEKGVQLPGNLMLEGDELPYTEYLRLANVFKSSVCSNGTPLIREARSIKTPYELDMFRESAQAHARAYRRIPEIYRPGMDDLHFSIEVERLMRLEGSLGIFRVFGQSMEIFMGSILAGSNAETPSPFDFALGGEGLHPALPGGVNRTPLEKGSTVMVDLGGNFNGYMGDISRVFSIGKTTEEAYRAHQVCLEVENKVASLAKPGTACQDLYQAAIEIVTDRKSVV